MRQLLVFAAIWFAFFAPPDVAHADNITISQGSGKTLGTDTVSGVEYQRMKIALGADNAVDTDLDSGQQTAANSVPVVTASNQPGWVFSETAKVAARTGAITTATSTSILPAQGSGVRTVITTFWCHNADGSAANTIELYNGASNSVSIRVAANGTVVMPFPSGLAGAANTAWTVTTVGATNYVQCGLVGYTTSN